MELRSSRTINPAAPAQRRSRKRPSPSRLDALPEEIKVLICECLTKSCNQHDRWEEQQALQQLCLVSRRWSRLAQEALYCNVVVTDINMDKWRRKSIRGLPPNREVSLKFLRALHHRPDLAKCVKHLNIHANLPGDTPITGADENMLLEIAKDITNGSRESQRVLRNLFGRIENGNAAAFMSLSGLTAELCFLLSSNLEHVALNRFPFRRTPDPLLLCTPAMGPDKCHFPALKHLDFVYCRTGPDWLRAIARSSRLRRLSLEVGAMAPPEDFTGFQALEDLSLLECAWNSHKLHMFFSTCPQLKTLK